MSCSYGPGAFFASVLLLFCNCFATLLLLARKGESWYHVIIGSVDEMPAGPLLYLKGANTMAVYRVRKDKHYTVLSNLFLRDRELSLRAKGLFSLMLSLPDDWHYSIQGLCTLCGESARQVGASLNELEKRGYLVRTRERTEGGRLGAYVYDLYECPGQRNASETGTLFSCPPEAQKPLKDLPPAEKPAADNAQQINTEGLYTDERSKENPSHPSDGKEGRDRPKTSGKTADRRFSGNVRPRRENGSSSRIECAQVESGSLREAAREEFLNAIGCGKEAGETGYEQALRREIGNLVTETLSSLSPTQRVGGQEYPAALVRQRFSQLTPDMVSHVVGQLENGCVDAKAVRRPREYLRAMLFNETATAALMEAARLGVSGLM